MFTVDEPAFRATAPARPPRGRALRAIVFLALAAAARGLDSYVNSFVSSIAHTVNGAHATANEYVAVVEPYTDVFRKDLEFLYASPEPIPSLASISARRNMFVHEHVPVRDDRWSAPSPSPSPYSSVPPDTEEPDWDEAWRWTRPAMPIWTCLSMGFLLVVSWCCLFYRWNERLTYAKYIGVWFGDGDVALYVFPTLVGTSCGWSWSYTGDGQYTLKRGSESRTVYGDRLTAVTPWIGRFVQTARLVEYDDECPLLARVRFSRPHWSTGLVPAASHPVQSCDASYLYHADTDRVELSWLGSAVSHYLPAGAFRSACARYRLATTKAFGVVSVSLQGATKSDEVVAMAMSLIKSDHDFDTAALPDLNNQPLYVGDHPEDARAVGIKPVSNVVYAVKGFGMGASMMSTATEKDTIERRINAPRSEYVGDEKMKNYAKRFLNYVVGGKTLLPCDHDRVAKQMNRPSQKANRAAVDTIMDFLPTTLKQLFMKREPVPVGNPARNICTVSPQRLYRMARFTLSAADHMQGFVWWVWGVGSGETARKYQRACASNANMQESDFSKFDASLGPFWLWFNRLFIYSLFPDHKDELDELLGDSEFQEVSTTLRQKFSYGCGRFSGVNETALFNTLDQAFVQYVSFREHGLSHKSAVARLEQCLLGGDDGIVPYIGQDLPKTAAIFGMKVTYRVFESNSPCRFLGRIYLNGANSADSVHDIADWLSTLHLVSCAGNTTTPQALVNTATGLWVTDRNTPLIREFCQSVFRAYPRLSRAIHANDQWWFATYDINDPFPLADYNDETIIFDHFATVMGIDPAGLYALNDWFKQNQFHVGARLPTLEVVFAPNLPCAYELYGVAFGIPAVPKPLPRMRQKEIEKLKEAVVVSTAKTPLLGDDDAPPAVVPIVTQALFGPNTCHRCGQAGHKVAVCPLKLHCKKCRKNGHIADKCTTAEEAATAHMSAAEADADAMGLGAGTGLRR